MKSPPFPRNQRGQALNEMLIVIPLLFLLAAGLAQVTLLIRAKIEFENACGNAARQFALGRFPSKDLGRSLWDDLGADQRYFDRGSLLVSVEQPQTTFGGDLADRLGFLGAVTKDGFFNYGGGDWSATIRYRAVPLFGVLFPNGILFHAHFSVLRHPA